MEINKKPIINWLILLLWLLSIIYIIYRANSAIWNEPKQQTAWYYLDQIIELRKEKQSKVNEINELNKRIEEYNKLKDKLQYSWFSYMSDPFIMSWQ